MPETASHCAQAAEAWRVWYYYLSFQQEEGVG